ALLGLFPGMLAVISIYGLVADPSTVKGVLGTFAGTLPPQARAVVNEALVAFVVRPSGNLTLRVVVGILAVLWSSSNGMGVLVRAINTASDNRERRSFFARRAVALLFTLSGVIGIAVVVPAVTAVPKLLHRVNADLLTLLGPPLVLAGTAFVALLVLFRYAPYKRPPQLREVAPGAAVASVAWLLVSGGYSLYVRYLAQLTSTYGALEGVVVLELWFYFSAIVLLYAAELNTVLRRGATSDGPSSVPVSRVPPSRATASERGGHSTGE
ncbi:MAG TPA: YihY/virulence factor BrkB family protein, partial [Polyangiaceae bacterium]|nr:YihY/virulence factor BrkB family protein [Polyangiaceae bacterium]